MGHYQISDLERLSGIRAHTIRIWEKRYNAIVPQRSSGNIRFYDDAQLKKLLNIALLVRSGYKISRIAMLDHHELHQLVQGTVALPEPAAADAISIHGLILAMLSFDTEAFDTVFSAAVSRIGIYETMIRVCYPFLHQTGVLWCIDEALPAQEHFASGIIRRKLMAAIDALSIPVKKSKRFVLFLPPGEWHEIPLLFAEYLVRNAGYPVVQLGQHVPYEDLEQVILAVQPTHILFFIVSGEQQEPVLSLLKRLQDAHPGIQYLAGGKADRLDIEGAGLSLSILEEPASVFRFF